MDSRDYSFIDRLLAEGKQEEALKLLNQTGDLKQPLASGKNLEALKQLSGDINYKDIVQDELYKTKPNFKMVGGPTETAFSQVADDFGKGKDLIVRQADDIVPKSKPIMDLVKSNANPAALIDDTIATTGRPVVKSAGKKALGLLGRYLVPAAGVAASAYSALDQPEANEVANQEQQLIENPGFANKAMGAMVAAKDANNEVFGAEPTGNEPPNDQFPFYDLSDSDGQHEFIDEVEKDAKSGNLDGIAKKNEFMKQNIAAINEEINKPGRNEKELQDAIDDRDSMIRTTMLIEGIAGMLSGLSNMSSGVATAPLKVNLQAMRDLAGERVKDVDKKRIARLRDPASDESKEMRDTIRNAGLAIPDNLSGETALKLFPQLAQLEARKEDRDARKENVALKREEMGVQREQKLTQRNQDFANKLTDQIGKKDSYKKMQTVDTAHRSIQSALKSKDGIADVSVLYDFVRALDPTSAVKEGEIDLIKSAGSYGQRMKLALSNLKNKRLLADDQKKLIADVVRKKHQDAYGQFENDIKPLINQAEERGLSKESYLPGLDYYKSSSEAAPTQARVKAPDGKIRLVPKDKLKAALDAGGVLVE